MRYQVPSITRRSFMRQMAAGTGSAALSPMVAVSSAHAAEQVTLEVCTTDGIVLFEQNESLMAGRNQLSIALTGIRSGKYLLKVLGKTELPEHVESFVKL